MDLGLAIIGNIDQKKTDLIVKLSDEMKVYFRNKTYGSDIKAYTIGIVCVAPQFAQFFKAQKPKYTKGKKVINPDGIPFTLEDSFEHSIKLDFETFKNSSEVEAKKYLAQEILKSLDIIETMKAKIKDFDLINFKRDLESYFKEKNLI
ncbi:hypothetical protein [Flavobacterium sp. N1736]|uniref:hypothetical protein n=1 Tax=Flavobacterium sp. N1736 TaxID=2986823 RepID=UPI002224E1D7|nr:hypothetical protein [Flavobacterium sp. N1736]